MKMKKLCVEWLRADIIFLSLWGSAYAMEENKNVIKKTEWANRTKNWWKMKLDQHHFLHFHLQSNQLKRIISVYADEENSINRNDKMDESMQSAISVGGRPFRDFRSFVFFRFVSFCFVLFSSSLCILCVRRQSSHWEKNIARLFFLQLYKMLYF